MATVGAWHEHHDVARSLLAARARLPAHVALEVYSVLTRLPEPFRAEPATVAEFLARTFDEPRLVLGEAEQAELPAHFAERGIAGGAVYDALIAMTAAASDAELYTLDRRALANYERCAVNARLLA